MPKIYDTDINSPVEIGSGSGKFISTPKSIPTGRMAKSNPSRKQAKHTGQTYPVKRVPSKPIGPNIAIVATISIVLLYFREAST